jgi:predicted DsbA family dithiol-disulfide isomerase
LRAESVQAHRLIIAPKSKALHWYDFLCPFCYVGQQRTALLVQRGLDVLLLPFRVHPEIPRGGVPAGSRVGPTYRMLEREAEAAGLPLHWPPHLPDTSRALAAAEWVRRHRTAAFPQVHKALFAAHFALGEDLEDPFVIERHAAAAGIERGSLNEVMDSRNAAVAVMDAEALARQHGVRGTPSWFLHNQLISGLRPAAEFERLAG